MISFIISQKITSSTVSQEEQKESEEKLRNEISQQYNNLGPIK